MRVLIVELVRRGKSHVNESEVCVTEGRYDIVSAARRASASAKGHGPTKGYVLPLKLLDLSAELRRRCLAQVVEFPQAPLLRRTMFIQASCVRGSV